MTEFEKFVINKLDVIDEKVHKIDKKLAFFAGGATIAATTLSFLLTKIF